MRVLFSNYWSKNNLDSWAIMIVIIDEETRRMASYDSGFMKAGEITVEFERDDFMCWIDTIDIEDASTIEGILIHADWDKLDTIKAIRKKSDAPIIALVDKRLLELTKCLYNHGVDDVVTMSVHCDELLIRMVAIKKRLIQNSNSISNKPIILYFDGRDPQICGEPIELPRRERRILEYLAIIKGRRASKSQLFGAIYGVFDEKIDENVIESHISKLRKKLRGKLGDDPIDSKRYLGYRLNPELIRVEKFTSLVA